jgi:hypothetical protein
MVHSLVVIPPSAWFKSSPQGGLLGEDENFIWIKTLISQNLTALP